MTQTMKQITTVENVMKDTRFMSDKIQSDRVDIYIKESQNENIKNQIGNSLFTDILAYINAEDKSSYPDYQLLLDGGTYEVKSNCSNSGDTMSFEGLITTLNYYAYARAVKNIRITVTRGGLKLKESEHSDNVDYKEVQIYVKDTLSLADKYLQECIDFLIANKSKYPKFKYGSQRSRQPFTMLNPPK